MPPRGSRTPPSTGTSRGGRPVPPPYSDYEPEDRTRTPGGTRDESTYTPDDDPRRPDPDGGRSYPGGTPNGPGGGPGDDINRQSGGGRQPDGGSSDMGFGALNWLIAQQQRRNPYMEALRTARSGGYAADLQKWAAMRGAGAGQIGAIGSVLARDASARTTGAALEATPQFQSQRDSALAQLLGTKFNASLTREQMEQQYRMFQQQLDDNRDARSDASRDSRNNQIWSMVGGIAGLGLSALLPGPWSPALATAGFGIGSSVGNNASGRMNYAPPASPTMPALQALTQSAGMQYGTPQNMAPASRTASPMTALDALTQQPGMAYGVNQTNNPYSFLSQYQPYSASVSGWDQNRR